MLATLRVGEIGSIVLVYRQAKATFERTNVVFEEIRIFVKVDSFEGKFSKSFATICIGSRL